MDGGKYKTIMEENLATRITTLNIQKELQCCGLNKKYQC